MRSTLLYQIALTLIPGIGCVQARHLLEHFEPEEIFKTSSKHLEKVEGIGSIRASGIRTFADFEAAEQEIDFLEKYNIKPLFIADDDYPKRLLHCYDAPLMLYYRGSACLNHSRIISIVGSRAHTDYGRAITELFVEQIAQEDVLIVSGLAYGIDAVAHAACLKNQVQTVGVLAHGLDKIYPPHHTKMAKEMIRQGGLLTEFRRATTPDRHHFPSRNRIVAGMSDATIVIETDIKGGSMITAELANGYNRDVFAVPGKTTDKKSAGCNYLIKNNKAILLTDADQLLETLGWKSQLKKKRPLTKELFLHLSPEEKIIVALLQENNSLTIDEINLKSGLSSSAVAAGIINLEMQHVLRGLPGKVYQIA
ncbi:DNA-processing protein DprA [Niabella insulamsoli]|uniref:DNA-processing protein DprA n=1 Tax=Niabella insulamsoli TaxID=3144874 RepID=UPI0031FC2633